MVGRMEDLHWKRRFRLEWQTYDCLRNDTPHDRLRDCIWTRRKLRACKRENGNISTTAVATTGVTSRVLNARRSRVCIRGETSAPRCPDRNASTSWHRSSSDYSWEKHFFALPNSITEKFCEEKELARNLLSIHAALEKHHFWGPADVPTAIYYRCPPLFYPLWPC